MTSLSKIPKLYLKDCIGCGICVEVCPTHAIPTSIVGFISTISEINEEKCNGCGECIEICPHGAIKYLKKG